MYFTNSGENKGEGEKRKYSSQMKADLHLRLNKKLKSQGL